MNRKILIGILILSIMIFPSTKTFAVEQSLSLTFQDATILAIQNNREITNLGKTIKKLRKQYAGSYAIDVINTDRYDLDVRMNELYDKMIKSKLMSLDEQGELLMLYTALNNTIYTKNMKLEPYISSVDFPNASVCSTIVKSNINKELLYISVENGVRQAFDSILKLSESIKISADLFEIQTAKYNQAEMNFKNGSISEQERFLCEMEMKKQKIELDKLKRNLKNLEMSFKKQIGIDLNKEIKLIAYNTDLRLSIDKYDKYLSEALARRSEIISVKMDLKAKEIELYRFNLVYRLDHRTDELDLYKKDIELQMVSLKNQLRESEETVEQDIRNAYVDLASKQISLENAKFNSDTASTNYKAAEIKNKTGTISKMNFKSAQITYNQVKIKYNVELRNFEYALYKMRNCCNVGPQYGIN